MPLGALLTLFLILASCSLSPRRIVQDSDDEGPWIPGRDFAVTQGDRDYRQETNQRSNFVQKSSLSTELEEKLSQLNSPERRRYQRIAPFLKSDSEKLYYLGLSRTDREDYVAMRFPLLAPKSRRLASIPSEHNPALASLTGYQVEKPIALNMSKREVVKLWGRPSRIDIAGNPALENERWIFVQQGGRQMVYFERGKVQGWSLID